MILKTVNIGIAFRLCQMHRHWCSKLIQIHVYPFDLIYRHSIRLRPYSIGTALNAKDKFIIFFLIYQRRFRAVIRRHTFLNFSVNTAAFLHCLLIRKSIPAVVQIPASEKEFNKRADRYADFR